MGLRVWNGRGWGKVGYGRRGLEVERMVGEGNRVEGMEW